MVLSRKLLLSVPGIAVVAANFVLAGIANGQEPTNYEEVLAAIDKSSVARSGWEADIELKMDMGTQSMSYSGHTKVQGELSNTRMLIKVAGRDASVLTVTDKDGMQWTEMDQGGAKQIMRVDTKKLLAAVGESIVASSGMGQGPGTPIDVNRSVREMLDEFSDSFAFEYQGTAEYADGTVYLIEGARTEGADSFTGLAAQLAEAGLIIERVVIAVGTEDGFPRSIEWFAKEDRVLLKLGYKNLHLNPVFSAGTFSYFSRPGATVMDMTSLIEQRLRAN